MPVRKQTVTKTARRPRRRRRRRSDSEVSLERDPLATLSGRDRQVVPAGKTRSLDTGTLLQAQRTLGNRAVLRMIEERDSASPESPDLNRGAAPVSANGNTRETAGPVEVKHRSGEIVQRGLAGDIWEGVKSAVGSAVEWLGDVFGGSGGGKGTKGKGSGSKSKGKGSGTTPKKSKADKKKEGKIQAAIKQATLTKSELDELNKKGKSELSKEWAGLAAEIKELDKQKEPLWKRRRSKKDPLNEAEKKQLDEFLALIKPKAKRIAAIKLILAKSDMQRELEGAKSSIDKWFGDIDPGATFLGIRIRPSKSSVTGGVHKELVTQLQAAENYLMSPAMQKKHGYKTKKEAAATFGIKGIGGLRPPQAATGGSRISMHCYGLAIDINASTNPFVGRSGTAIEVIKRATELVNGTPFNIGIRPKDIKVMDMYDLLSKANQALQLYFTLQTNDKLLSEKVEALNKKAEPAEGEKDKKKGKTMTAEQWKKQIKADLKDLKKTTDFGSRDPAKGFMDLPRDLVDGLVNGGKLTWGGYYKTAKDIMHFDYRGSSTIKR